MHNHEPFIDEALTLARRGRGWVSPNPMVGALVVRDGSIVGRGWHKQFGGPHAEIFALQEAGEAARGATLYCTLEPCNHTGKTPPCAEAVIKAGIATVVLGAPDANPVAAGGAGALRAAGIEVITGVRERECRLLNAGFFKHAATGLPLVSVKWAMSADGKIATASGDSKWITGEAARDYSHRLRGEHDAVLAGIGTLLADNSKLNCRCAPAKDIAIRQPRRVILDSAARLPLDAAIWSAEGGKPTVVCGRQAPQARIDSLLARGADVVQLDLVEGALPLEEMLRALGRSGVLSILVEGGSRVLGAFFDARLADRAFIFIAPRIIGGRDSITAVAGRGAATVAGGLELDSPRIDMLGPDLMLSGGLSNWCR